MHKKKRSPKHLMLNRETLRTLGGGAPGGVQPVDDSETDPAVIGETIQKTIVIVITMLPLPKPPPPPEGCR